MKAKTMLLGVIYSAVAAVIAAYVLQSSAGLAAESFMTAAVIVFIVSLVSALLTSTAGGSSASSAATIRGAEVVSADDANDQREGGVVKWFNVTKGFGFITRDQGDDVFVHFRSIRGTGHRSLTEGQRVKFEVVESDKGLQAEDVSVVA